MSVMRCELLLRSCNFTWALQFTCVKLVQNRVGSFFTVWGPMILVTVMVYPPSGWNKKNAKNRDWRISDIP